MTTITRERLLKIQQWRETYGPGSNVVLPTEEAEELARIALASLDAGSDSNNHPAHGPLSNDRLHRIRDILSKAAAQRDGGNIGYAMSDAVKAIDELLASRGTEPVFFIEVEGDDWIQAGRIPGSTFDFNELPDGIVNLYTAPPAPVVPPAIEPDYEVIKGILPTANPDEYACCIAADMWNACRAAMLNHSGRVTDMVEHVSQPYKLPPHVYRELVNQLHSTAMKYSGCQQLREQISRTLGTVLGPAHSHIK
ncbi:hypothetical protein [Citrobacter koseri]|uniref:hypothetical protein n=1 Tax=Citrobacter koseri TaxID=545 RepID=UPI0028BE95AF|nr:hypothetical protein [Citrobacter koseri]MDT7459956.1 hypothetical protein [Citrobacter koseri]